MREGGLFQIKNQLKHLKIDVRDRLTIILEKEHDNTGLKQTPNNSCHVDVIQWKELSLKMRSLQ